MCSQFSRLHGIPARSRGAIHCLCRKADSVDEYFVFVLDTCTGLTSMIKVPEEYVRIRSFMLAASRDGRMAIIKFEGLEISVMARVGDGDDEASWVPSESIDIRKARRGCGPRGLPWFGRMDAVCIWTQGVLSLEWTPHHLPSAVCPLEHVLSILRQSRSREPAEAERTVTTSLPMTMRYTCCSTPLP